MNYSKLHWYSDWMYSEIYGEPESEEGDTVVGYYSVIDFPEINMYIDVENNRILEVWLDVED